MIQGLVSTCLKQGQIRVPHTPLKIYQLRNQISMIVSAVPCQLAALQRKEERFCGLPRVTARDSRYALGQATRLGSFLRRARWQPSGSACRMFWPALQQNFVSSPLLAAKLRNSSRPGRQLRSAPFDPSRSGFGLQRVNCFGRFMQFSPTQISF